MDTFEEYRPYLFAIAYRMVGSVSDAEDMVQETYLRFRQVDAAQVVSPRSYLSSIITRLCLDYLKSAQVQREQYLGPWLPEPLLTLADSEPARTAERLDSISVAFLVLLEKLTPYERAVFLLREVFNYDYEEIAAIVGKEAATCRQHLSRAKKHLTDHRPRFEVQPAAHTEITTRFVAAARRGTWLAWSNSWLKRWCVSPMVAARLARRPDRSSAATGWPGSGSGSRSRFQPASGQSWL